MVKIVGPRWSQKPYYVSKQRGIVTFLRALRAYNLTMTKIKYHQHLFYIPDLKIVICLVKRIDLKVNYIAENAVNEHMA